MSDTTPNNDKPKGPVLHPEVAEMVWPVIKRVHRTFAKKPAELQAFELINTKTRKTASVFWAADGGRTKDRIADELRKTAKDMDANVLVSVMEVWMREVKAPEGMSKEEADEHARRESRNGPAPSEAPDRQEVVMIVVELEGAVWAWRCPIHRKGAGGQYDTFDLPDLKQPSDMTGWQGRFANILPANEDPADREFYHDPRTEEERAADDEAARREMPNLVREMREKGDPSAPIMLVGDLATFVDFLKDSDQLVKTAQGYEYLGMEVRVFPGMAPTFAAMALGEKLSILNHGEGTAWVVERGELGLPADATRNVFVREALKAAGGLA